MSSRGQSLILEELNLLKGAATPRKLQTSFGGICDSMERSSSRKAGTTDIPSQPRCTKSTYYEVLGFHGSMVSTTGSQYSTYSFDLRFNNPFPAFFGSRIFSAHLSIRRFAMARSSLFLLPQSGLSIHNLVAEESPIMLACKKGDLKAVQFLLQTRQAQPNDATDGNMTTIKVRYI